MKTITITETLIASYARFFCYAYTLTGLVDIFVTRLWLSTIISIAIVMATKIYRALTKKTEFRYDFLIAAAVGAALGWIIIVVKG